MLVARQHRVESQDGQGRLDAIRTELQRRSAADVCEEGLRQRLFDLARRVTRVQALGGEYARVGLSEQVQAALGDATVT